MKIKFPSYVRDDTHDIHQNCPIFKTPNPLVHLRPKFFHSLALDVQFQMTSHLMIPCMWTNEIKIKTKPSTSHSVWPRVPFFDLAPRTMQWCHQNNGIIHCLTSKGWSLVNNINVWLGMMSGHGANPIFFNKKKKDWTSGIPVNPQPPYVQ